MIAVKGEVRLVTGMYNKTTDQNIKISVVINFNMIVCDSHILDHQIHVHFHNVH